VSDAPGGAGRPDEVTAGDDADLAQRFWRPAGRRLRDSLLSGRGFGGVLVLTFVTLLVIQAASDSRAGATASALALTLTVSLALARSNVRRRWVIGTLAYGTVLVVVVLLDRGGGDTPALLQTTSAVMFTILVGVALPSLLLAAFGHSRITLDTVAAAITAYLLIGLFFGLLFQVLALVDTGSPFFAGDPPVVAGDYVYFSMVTLATVGYGDLTPANGLGRGLATSGAVLGQLYLVTTLALTVSRLGETRRTTRDVL